MVVLTPEARSSLRSRVSLAGEAIVVVEEPKLPPLPYEYARALEDDASACAAGLDSIGRDWSGERPVGLVVAEAGPADGGHLSGERVFSSKSVKESSPKIRRE